MTDIHYKVYYAMTRRSGRAKLIRNVGWRIGFLYIIGKERKKTLKSSAKVYIMQFYLKNSGYIWASQETAEPF